MLLSGRDSNARLQRRFLLQILLLHLIAASKWRNDMVLHFRPQNVDSLHVLRDQSLLPAQLSLHSKKPKVAYWCLRQDSFRFTRGDLGCDLLAGCSIHLDSTKLLHFRQATQHQSKALDSDILRRVCQRHRAYPGLLQVERDRFSATTSGDHVATCFEGELSSVGWLYSLPITWRPHNFESACQIQAIKI